ncbi:MAG: protein translocase subunit SecD [Chloroflexi bacterium HGW-Chloroflexi-2]|jgi:preprotein translocase subunit SecD|nr:MAG: protein translocase subunit SecD [Chloroflexi bacterium HGW-Chloroflexi-2]
MKRRYTNLILILVLLAAVIWIDLPSTSQIPLINKSISTVLGLDLRGGMQVILKADLPEDSEITSESLQVARQILENRSNGLGVSEVVFQVAGSNRIVGEFPGASNAEDVIEQIKQTGVLEFVDIGDNLFGFLPGDEIVTDFTSTTKVTAVPSPASLSIDPDTGETEKPVFHTVMTGIDLKAVGVNSPIANTYEINFELTRAGRDIFAEHTTNNIGKFLAIVLDNKLISAPTISTAITEGTGTITGSFTIDEANALAVQLRYGSLPIPLVVEQIRVIGPTLGQDSLEKSLIAGLIGFTLVALFMAIFYKVPGILADFSIIIYALITFALFRLIPVTLTLPGIAGFLLSTGSALDANILIFERLKEELRNGRTLSQAIALGWKRAWPSIRDSNIATLITCSILFWFGSTFGASFVKGFAITLALGVGVSLFSAIFVTRTFLAISLDVIKHPENHLKWFGI